MMDEKYKNWIPKVGDKVRLLKSNINWSDERLSHELSMTEIVEQYPIVEITKTSGNQIYFEKDCGWFWSKTHNHFEFYEYSEEIIKEDLSSLINLLKSLNIN